MGPHDRRATPTRRLVWMKEWNESERQMTGRRVLGIGRRRVVVGVSAVCVLLCLLCLLRVVDGFDGAWEDAFGPSERANERPLVDDEKGTSERLSSSSSSPSPRSRSSRSRSPRSSPRPSVAVVVT